MPLPRLRQAVLVARDLPAVAAELEDALGVSDPFRDAGVGAFGLHNAVYCLGGDFIEIVSPTRDGTAAGRHLDRIGGDGGYMCMVEAADEAALRERIARLGARIVNDTRHDDIVDIHLHPADLSGAIVAVNVTNPPGSWRWGGPDWVGNVPAHGPGRLRGLTVEVPDPRTAATRWGTAFGIEPADDVLHLDDDEQVIRFVPGQRGITAIDVDCEAGDGPRRVAGVEFRRRRVTS
jgi:hypothetical protein